MQINTYSRNRQPTNHLLKQNLQGWTISTDLTEVNDGLILAQLLHCAFLA